MALEFVTIKEAKRWYEMHASDFIKPNSLVTFSSFSLDILTLWMDFLVKGMPKAKTISHSKILTCAPFKAR